MPVVFGVGLLVVFPVFCITRPAIGLLKSQMHWHSVQR